MSGPIASTEWALRCEFVPRTLAGTPCSRGLPRAVRDDPRGRVRISPSVLRRKCSFSGQGEDRDLPMGSRRICLFRAHLAMLQHLSGGGRAEEEEGVSRVIKRGERCPRWVIMERCYPAWHTPGRAADSPAWSSCPFPASLLASRSPCPVLPLDFCDEIYFFSTASDS